MEHLRNSNKYLEHNKDEEYQKEFEFCWGVTDAKL